MVLLSRIEKAADGDWRAAAWKLERLFPESYGRRKFASTSGFADTCEASIYTAPQSEDHPEDTLAEVVKVLSEMGFLLPQSDSEGSSVQNYAGSSNEDSG